MAQEPVTKHKLGKILVALKYANVDQVKEALEFQRDNPGQKLGHILVTMGHCTDVHIARALAKQRGVPFLDAANLAKVVPDILALVTPEQVKEHRVVPVLHKGNTLTVASPDIMEFFTLDNLRFIFGCEVNYCIAPEKALGDLVKNVYGIEDFSAAALAAAAAKQNAVSLADMKVDGDEDEEGVVAQLVQTILSDAVKRRASDIHVEPMEDKLRIRYRIDGECREMECPPKRLQGSVISRIKILAGLDITDKRLPQDGRIKAKIEGRDIDLRVSSLPCFYGESVVMRILDKAENIVSLDTLGMHASDFERFQRMIQRPTGIFLVTGPTGSGSATSAFASGVSRTLTLDRARLGPQARVWRHPDRARARPGGGGVQPAVPRSRGARPELRRSSPREAR